MNKRIPVTSLTCLSADTKTCPWVELPQLASGFAQNTYNPKSTNTPIVTVA